MENRWMKKRAYRDYLRGAQRRKLDFQITLEEFDEIIRKPCHYCGDAKGNAYTSIKHVKRMRDGSWDKKSMSVTRNGIDRVDNKIGYIKGNMVPCCKRCNYAKGGLSIEEFKSEILIIHAWVKELKKRFHI